ncbi:MAG: penicillin-binding transpeptidase domain-containing protein [Clostridium sp.]|nr:penicillin-binding transpeptidase domain-containing protein [Clostridium sp.]
MKKGLKIAIIGVVAILLAGGAFGIYYIRNNSSKPEKVLEEYFDLLKDKKYDEMYNLISKEAQGKISSEDFVKRNKNIYEGVGAVDIEVEVKETTKDSRKATVNYDFTMNTSAGEINFSNEMKFTKDDGKNFVIDWSSNLIFPELNDNYKIRINSVAGKRGSILDRNGNILAADGKAANVGIVPGRLVNKEEAINSIAQILEMSPEDINKKISASYVQPDTFVPLKVIPGNDARKDQLLKITGIKITDKVSRIYPLGAEAAHLTGYVQAITADELKELEGKGYTSSSVIGKSGAEKLYEDKLKGNDGVEIYIEDEKGSKKSTVISKDVKDGQNVKLTIDNTLQSNLYKGLAQDKGASVAMNPNTGEVLALVSTPSYDPNDFVLGMSSDKWNTLNNDPNKPMYNRFKAGFAPGSTFKPITGAIGLETKTIDPNKDMGITSNSWQKDSSWGSYNVTRVHGYENANLENAMVYSDNIYFAMAALNIGSENFCNKLKSFGFGEDIPFDFGLAKSQYSDDGSNISKEVQLADSGYGQGKILVTPVHLATMYTMFANEGNILTPTLLADGASKKVWKENVISKESASIILNDMIQVVKNPNGTGHGAMIDGLTIAAKTGTAELKASQDDKTGTETGWFAAMTTNRAKGNVLIVSMAEDAKDKGGSGYLVPKVHEALMAIQ